MSINNKVRKARMKFFKKDLLFFGTQANKFLWDIKELPESIEGCVQYDPENLNELSFGSIELNEKFISKSNYSHDNLCFIICHELLHILNKHGARRGQRDPVLWNVACDHVIECQLRSMSNVIQPHEGRYNIVSEIENNLGKCTAEQAYKWLEQNQPRITIKMNGPGGQGGGNEQDDQQGQQPQTATVTIKDGNGNEESFTVNINEDLTPQEEQQVNQFISEARAVYNNYQERGLIGGQMAEYLKEILKVEIPWEELLEKAIKNNVQMKPDGRCWQRLNNYFIPHNMTLPGYSLVEEGDGVGILIICVDCSGSINTKELKKFSGVIEKSMQYFREIKLLVHDIGVNQEKEFNKDNILEFYDFLAHEGYKGRGGTSHRPVFDKIKDIWEESQDELSMVISLTDGESDITEIYKRYEWIKNNLPLVFLITRTSDFHIDPDFGEISKIWIDKPNK